MYIVLSRNSHDVTSFNDWISDVADKTIIITKSEYKLTYVPFFNVIGLENYDSFDEKINAIQSTIDCNKIQSIVAISEFDLEDAARCRNFFNVQGQSETSAKAFRNKLIMKKLIANAGIPIAKHICATSLKEVETFGEVQGFPIIVKPIDGGGSANTFKLDSKKDVWSKLRVESNSIYLCETFINGGMIHCDGIYEDGEIKLLSISEYIGSCLSYQVGEALASYQIQEHSDKWIDGKKMLIKVLSALPCPQVMGFHAEFFVTEYKKLVFCEIASRLGGGRIIDTVEQSHKISMAKYWVRKQFGLQDVVIEKNYINDIFGFVLIPPRQGILTYIPEIHPFDWISGYRKHYDILTSTKPAETSVDSVVSYLVKAKSTQEIKSRIEESIIWFTENIQY